MEGSHFALLGPRFQDMSFDAVAHHQDVPKADRVAPWGMDGCRKLGNKARRRVVDNDSCAAAVITHADNPVRRNTASGTREMPHDRG